MRIAHLFPNINEVVVESYVKFINNNFNKKNHLFYIVTYNKPLKAAVMKYQNVMAISTLNTKNIKEIIANNDKVILHYLSLKKIQMLKLLFYQEVYNKLVWVAWGHDLYSWSIKENGKIVERFIQTIKNKIAFAFRRKIKCFVGIFPPDIDFFRKEFNTNATTFYAPYTASLYNPIYKKVKFDSLEEKINNNDCINIQIGHSSTDALNHIEALKCLEKYKDENIRIYIPLSYGDKEYGDLVEEKAKEIFGCRAVCIREMMPQYDYMMFLSTIDIAIFNTKRQIGLGNIKPLLYMEKKIFIPKGSVMYDFFRNQKVDIWDYNEVANYQYRDFVQPLRFKGGLKYIADNELNLNNKKCMWNKVFEFSMK